MATKPKDGDKVKARVLVTGAFGQVNDVVEVEEVVLKQTDELDASTEAVAYAESLKGQ